MALSNRILFYVTMVLCNFMTPFGNAARYELQEIKLPANVGQFSSISGFGTDGGVLGVISNAKTKILEGIHLNPHSEITFLQGLNGRHADSSRPVSANRIGTVVGSAKTAGDLGPLGYPVVWNQSQPTVLTPGKKGTAVSINDQNEIVGFNWNDERTTAFYWRNGTAIELKPASDRSFAFARAINSAGVIAGVSYFQLENENSGSGKVPTVWKNLQPTPLPTPEGFDLLDIRSISDQSDVIGTIGARSKGCGNYLTLAVVWKNQVTNTLEPLPLAADPTPADYLMSSQAVSANSQGHVVGETRQCIKDPMTKYSIRATLWENGVPVDLNKETIGLGHWTLVSARSISEAGVILVLAKTEEENLSATYKIFLLSPLPQQK